MTAFKEGLIAEHPYLQRLEQLAEERLGPGRVEVLNAGMGGYNSFHGLLLLRTTLRDLEPDLITVRFGWNDHFTSRATVGVGLREPANPVALAAQDLLLRTATYRSMLRLGNELRARRDTVQAGSVEQLGPILTLEEFRRNLSRIVKIGTEMGARVWLVTAPDPFGNEEMLQRYESLPAGADARRMISIHALSSFRELMEIHRQYTAVVREVGADLGVPVVDMAAVFDARAAEALFLLDDPVHPRPKGYDLEAEVLYDRLVSEGLVTSQAAEGPH